MKTYRIEVMTNRDYAEMMNGGYNYEVREILVKAETKEEAIRIVEKKDADKWINRNYVKTLEEIEEEKIKREERIKAEKEKEERAKAKRKANEIKKAEELGITVEELRERKKKEALKKRTETEIKKLRAEIERLEKEVAEKERKLREA